MSFKKKIVSFLTTAACAVSCVGVSGMLAKDSAKVTAAGVSGLDAKGVTAQMKIGWNLGNTLESTNDNLGISSPPKKFATAWGQPEPTKELVDAVHAGGFNTIRIPVTWYQHIYEDGGEYKVDDVWMEYVKNVVDYAYDQDMFVILNIHHENFINVKKFTDETLADASKKMKGIWTRVAEEFKDYDQKLIFEGMNEPRQTGNPAVSEWGNGSEDGGYSWKYIDSLNSVFVETVRANKSSANQERLLMIPGYVASTDSASLSQLNIPENGGNIAISIHAYSPYFFCMATDQYANHEYPGKSGYGEDYKESLVNMFNSLKGISEKKNVPMIMGEFSASDFNNTDSRIAWAKDYLSLAKDAGIPCVLWDNNVVADTVSNPESAGEAHGYIYRMTNTWYPNSKKVVEAMMDTIGVTGYKLPDYVAYEKPAFSWDNVEIGDNWVEIYKSEKGDPLKTWEPLWIDGYKPYLNENYDLVMIMDADQEPALVAQTSTVFDTDNDGDGKPDTGWYYASSDSPKNKDCVYFFTYDDIVNAVTASGKDSMDKVNGFYVSARMSTATAYGLYAIPKEGYVPTEPTEKPSFSWDNVMIGKDWIEIYKNEKGAELDAWEPLKASGFEKYLNKDHAFVMIMDAAQDPAIVAQTSTVLDVDNDGDGEPDTGWYYASSDSDKNSEYVYYYTYEDIEKAVTASGNDSMDKVVALYLSARMSKATAYGLYAVPVGSGSTGGDEKIAKGDVNGDGVVDVFDSILLKRYVIEIPSNIIKEAADLDGNGKINVTDVVYLNMFLINSDLYPIK